MVLFYKKCMDCSIYLGSLNLVIGFYTNYL